MIYVCFRVYKIHLGNTNYGPSQTSDLSWWPKHATFISSGLWPGYWSHSCEEWFQTRHKLIAEHRGDLKTATEWKNAMKLYKQVSKLRDANSAAASQYLSTHTARFS